MFSGDFEIHLTGSEWQVDELAAFAARRGVKFSHIQLHQGVTPSQPMLTVSDSGTLAELHDLAARWRADLAEEGLRVVRVKIEAAPWNEGVPRSDEDARDDLYFEHHVKVLLSAPRERIRALVRPEFASVLEGFVEDGDLPEMDVFWRYSAMADEAEPWLRRLVVAPGAA